MSSVGDSLSDCNNDVQQGPPLRAAAGGVAGGGASRLDTVGISGEGSIEVLPQGAIARVKRPGAAGRLGSGKRGEVRGMSAASRRRLQELLLAVDVGAVAAPVKRARWSKAFLVTLTHEFLPERLVVKAQLKAWRKRLEYYLPPFSAIWVLEMQDRGVPHFHVLVIFEHLVSWAVMAKVCRKSWVEITGAKVVDVQSVYGDGPKLTRYLAKYLTKGWQSDEAWGRVWGVWNKHRLPLSAAAIVVLSRAGMVAFLRLLRRWRRDSKFLRRRTIQTGGAVIFCRPHQVMQLVAASV